MPTILSHRTDRVCRLLNRRHNTVLGAAAADIAFEFASNLRLGGRWISPEKPRALHDHAGRAVAALHRVAINERPAAADGGVPRLPNLQWL